MSNVAEENQTVQKVYDEGFARVTVRKIKVKGEIQSKLKVLFTNLWKENALQIRRKDVMIEVCSYFVDDKLKDGAK